VTARHKVLYSDYPGTDRAVVARTLLRKAAASGLDIHEVRSISYGFSVPLAWAQAQGFVASSRTRPVIVERPAPPPARPAAPAPAALFNPAEHNAARVIAHLDAADFDERVRVVAAEAEGKNRSTIAKWRPNTE
jgi:hypothetical protein